VPITSAVDGKFEPRSSQTNWYLSAKHATFRGKRKDRLSRNWDYVSEWSYVSPCGLLFQWDNTIKIQLSVMVYYKKGTIIISSNYNMFLPWYSLKHDHLVLNNNHSLTDVFLCHMHSHIKCMELFKDHFSRCLNGRSLILHIIAMNWKYSAMTVYMKSLKIPKG